MKLYIFGILVAISSITTHCGPVPDNLPDPSNSVDDPRQQKQVGASDRLYGTDRNYGTPLKAKEYASSASRRKDNSTASAKKSGYRSTPKGILTQFVEIVNLMLHSFDPSMPNITVDDIEDPGVIDAAREWMGSLDNGTTNQDRKQEDQGGTNPRNQPGIERVLDRSGGNPNRTKPEKPEKPERSGVGGRQSRINSTEGLDGPERPGFNGRQSRNNSTERVDEPERPGVGGRQSRNNSTDRPDGPETPGINGRQSLNNSTSRGQFCDRMWQKVLSSAEKRLDLINVGRQGGAGECSVARASFESICIELIHLAPSFTKSDARLGTLIRANAGLLVDLLPITDLRDCLDEDDGGELVVEKNEGIIANLTNLIG